MNILKSISTGFDSEQVRHPTSPGFICCMLRTICDHTFRFKKRTICHCHKNSALLLAKTRWPGYSPGCCLKFADIQNLHPLQCNFPYFPFESTDDQMQCRMDGAHIFYLNEWTRDSRSLCCLLTPPPPPLTYVSAFISIICNGDLMELKLASTGFIAGL